VTLRTALGPEVGNVRADAGQLEQVIMNLAVNASDAMSGGGKLTIETANAELGEDYAEAHQPVAAGQYVMLAVTDTGVGISPEIRPRIFEPFFTTKEPGKGTGLGLATVYGIVKQSGGYIWVYSEPGRGATFKVYLPRVDAPVESLAPARPVEGTTAGTETILLAEDDEQLRKLVRGLLDRMGYRVLSAAGAEDALGQAREHRGHIHLLLSDIVMPGEGGHQLARRLAETRPAIRALFMSGYTDAAIVDHGILERGLHYLQKPFTPAVLARRVRDVLDAEEDALARQVTEGGRRRTPA
jgi:CheY-like chemotaxis protein